MAIHLRETLLSEETIRSRVRELADRISSEHAGHEVLLIGVLRGAFIFLADLVRVLAVPSKIDFIAVSSYGKGLESGAVRLVMDLREDIAGRHVILVEDIVDSGRTLTYLRQMLSARRPASLQICALVRKPDCLEVELPVDYLGFDIPNVWVVGYGLDCMDEYRGLPYVAAVEVT